MFTQRPAIPRVTIIVAVVFSVLAMGAGALASEHVTYAWGVALGGSAADNTWCAAIDPSGNFIATGHTSSSNFPVVNGYLGTGFAAGNSFIAKFSPSGSLVWSVVLGGANWPGNCGNVWVACDALGSVYAACSASGIAVAKITPAGQLEWTTSFGNGNVDCLVVDSRGIPYVSGTTTDPSFPVTVGPPAKAGARSCFVTALAPDTGGIAWSMCFGGSGIQYPHALRVDHNDDLVMAGTTDSADFPTTDGTSKVLDGDDDFFFAKIHTSAGVGFLPGTFAWSTLVGGDGREWGGSLEVDGEGNVLFCGITASLDFPNRDGATVGDFALKLTAGGVLSWVTFRTPGQPCFGQVHRESNGNVYAASGESGGMGAPGGATMLSPEGEVLWRCPVLGMDFMNDITVDSDDGVVLFGWTDSPSATVKNGFQTQSGGGKDAYVVKITRQGEVAWATYVGGTLDEDSTHVAVDGSGGAYLYGNTAPYNPFFTPALPGMPAGGKDVFVARVDTLNARNTNWLDITALQMGLPASLGRDSFAIKGACNILPPDNAPETVTLTIDGWSIAMDASSWKRVGRSNVYTFRQNGVFGKMTYRVKGSSKCLFSFIGSRQMLKGYMSNLPSVPLRLQVGEDFDQTLTAEMKLQGPAAKVASFGPLPIFWVQKLKANLNKRQVSRDSLALHARLFLASAFDPAADAVTIEIGPYVISLPAGTLPAARNGMLRYRTPTANGTLNVLIDTNKGTLAVVATGIDLSSLTSVIHVSVTITNHAGAEWDYRLLLAENKAGTVHEY